MHNSLQTVNTAPRDSINSKSSSNFEDSIVGYMNETFFERYSESCTAQVRDNVSLCATKSSAINEEKAEKDERIRQLI